MKQSTIALALLPLLFTPVTKARTPEMPVLENRAAQGDITAPGGARRLTADQTAALRDSLSDKPAKNIILLIGDGMGDSEITAARNYAEGAGGFFKGIDALPLTGQYTHYALNKKPENRTTSPTRLHQQPPGQPVSKPITARWASIFTKKITQRFWKWQKPQVWRPVTFLPQSCRMPRPPRWWRM
ncbi:alkaline phosphatase H domain protein [Escherichia coli DEC3F]|nr:alkaline phosphatase H domain protein [Escherichia coli DEC3A]EHU66771.1 alkaline phosphatase H domain protein [Escherichia coli DEC3B]EHU78413.1 alkaline phosphatase H domain protein [Escherichia coli DEC3C]EHU84786.1 alkaline phosphatase H domain protein [Escherichia coli DEC3E]EHU96354.1 alkaline phosphatase H domain protein [Escherichia coli DEC3F]EHU98241.1 alkaline phosphatase H domain protein [Escherichia coli DEC4A]EHV15122.1 alkaline phosphatase H domain protein [Escherichia coli 